MKGELLSGDSEAAEHFKSDFYKFVEEEGLTPEQTYNADESGLYWKCCRCGLWLSKRSITIMTCASAKGIHKLSWLVIGKAKKPLSFKGTEGTNLPVNYYNQKSKGFDEL